MPGKKFGINTAAIYTTLQVRQNRSRLESYLVIQTRSEVFLWKKRLQTLNLYVQDDPLHANICLLHLAIRRLVAHHVQESPESLVGRCVIRSRFVQTLDHATVPG